VGKDDRRKRAAEWLAEAAIVGDVAVSKKYRISPRTLRRWRDKAVSGSDRELTADVQRKKAAVEAGWADKLETAMAGCVDFIDRASREADPQDPDAIHAIAGALKMLQSVRTTGKLLDGRLRSAAGIRPVQQDAGQVAPAGNIRELKRTG